MYLEAYLNNVADDDTKVKYSSVLPDTADQIYSNFKTVLKEECDRPLFVTVYTELWIYKDGCISVTSLDEMLAAFLKREEDRWLLCLDNHSNLLKDYYYIPKYEWIGFSQAARLGTVTQFDMFLLHAIEDFPDKKSYMEMEFAPLEDERDRFGQRYGANF